MPGAGIKGVFCGGTQMTPQIVRFLVEEVLDNRAQFVPTYGNTLMGLACSKPLKSEDNWSVTYYAPQPRAVCPPRTGERLNKSSAPISVVRSWLLALSMMMRLFNSMPAGMA